MLSPLSNGRSYAMSNPEDCPNSEFPELDKVVNEGCNHLFNCFPKMEVKQVSVTKGYITLIAGDCIELIPEETFNSWTVTCRCGWTQTIDGSDGVPSWEDVIPLWDDEYDRWDDEFEGGEDEDS
jgi:hypothetical protein